MEHVDLLKMDKKQCYRCLETILSFFFAMINSVKNKQTFQEERTNLCFFPMHVMFVNKFSWKTWKFNKQQTWCHSRLLDFLLSNRNHQISTDTDLTSSSEFCWNLAPGAEALVSATRWKMVESMDVVGRDFFRGRRWVRNLAGKWGKFKIVPPPTRK